MGCARRRKFNHSCRFSALGVKSGDTTLAITMNAHGRLARQLCLVRSPLQQTLLIAAFCAQAISAQTLDVPELGLKQQSSHESLASNDGVGSRNTSNRSECQGVVTWVDEDRKLVVLQDGNDVHVLKLDLTNNSIRLGDRVVLECELEPFIPALPDFPNSPLRQEVRDSFESPSEQGDFYLSRMRGFLRPPATGDYTFWIASDDGSELWLSDSKSPQRARRIAGVPEGRYTDQHEWTRIATQQSQSIHLEAGRSYYIEALHQESRGRDFVAVAWQGPGFEREVIPGKFLSPWPPQNTAPDDSKSEGVLWEYWTNYFTSDLSLVRSKSDSVLNCRAARVVKRDRGEMPVPLPFPVGEPLNSRAAYRLVGLEGRLQFVSHADGWLVLELDHGSSRITARVRTETDLASVLPQHSIIRVTGVFEPTRTISDDSLSGTLWMERVDDIRWLDTEENWTEVEPLPQYQLSPANPGLAAGQIIHLQGRVVSEESPGLWRLQGADTFFAYTSQDGANWSPLGVPVEAQMSNSVLTGIAMSSYASNELVQARFDHVSGLVPELSGANIGSPSLAGRYRFQDGTFIVEGNGEDVWHQADQCFFAYHPGQNDVEMIAHLAEIKSADVRVKAVLMVRESLAADSAWAGIAMMPSQRLGLQSRRQTGDNAAGLMQTQPAQWVRLLRRRNSFLVRANPDSFGPDQSLEVLGRLEWRERTPILSDVRFRFLQESSRAPVVPVIPAPSLDGMRPALIRDLWADAESTLPAGYRNPLRSKLAGVVTFQDEIGGEWFCILQDKSGAARLQLGTGIPRSLFRVGRSVEIVCTPMFTGASPEFLVYGVAGVGPAEMPPPRSLSSEFPADSMMDAQWAETEGVVRSVLDEGRLSLMTGAGRLDVRSASPFTADHVDSRVRLRGVFWPRPRPTLLLSSKQFLEILQPSPANPFSVPTFPVSAVETNKTTPQSQRRTKVSGVVTCRRSNFLIVQDSTGGIRLETQSVNGMEIGEEVEAVGFPDYRSYGVVLTEVVLRRVGQGRMPRTIELATDDGIDSGKNGLVVSVEALVLEQRSWQGNQLLDLQAGQRAFRAVLPIKSGRMSSIASGSKVRVTGVSQIESVEGMGGESIQGEKPLVASLELLLRSPADVIVLQRPPWWTWEYTMAAIAISLGIFAGTVFWIRTLRRRVEQRTRELRVAMDRLERETRISATLAERDRLAGEIHDSVEQGLSAIVMQMEAASQVVNQPDQVTHYLTMVKNMAGFSRSEVQHAVWDMQSPLLENADLATALRRVAHDISAGDTPRVTLEIVGTAYPLASTVEHHLLRIAQEAITNAVKHASPKAIDLTLQYTASDVTLKVHDDGAGFDTHAVSANSGHFGLQGMRARAGKIDADLRVASKPGGGTCIELVVPRASSGSRSANGNLIYGQNISRI